jgi:glycosyltransferase involved in cell wall biosynthesis
VTVVHVINRWGPGGAEKQLGELLDRLSLPQEVIEFQGRDADRRRDLGSLRRRLAAARPDVVVAWLDRSQIAVALTASRGVRLVASVRGLPRRRSITSSWAMRLALSRYDRLVANSMAARVATLSFARPMKLSAFDVVPNGVEIPSAPRAPSRAPRLRVGFIGRDSPDKGLDVCLDALALLGDEVAACLIGHGVPEAVAGRPAGATWRTFGRISDPWRHCGDLDVLLIPSRSEGSPNVALEAFARGVPVIGTPAGGAAELLACDRGLLVPVGDAPALAAAVRSLGADRRAAAERASRARDYVERHHAWAHVVARWETLLDEAISGRRSALESAQAPATA